jgi:2-polyprenyl-3-methyl-5-hydroxy-6-metoxy-1,4-benzoquinol methylase
MQFDALRMSEVLEHLVDPWATLNRLSAYLKPGEWVFASSPNVSHKDIIKQLLRGRWDLAESGAMDRTHLRWFTPKSYVQLFEGADISVEHVGPLDESRTYKQRVFSTLTRNCFDHIFAYQINLVGTKNDRSEPKL